MARYTADLHVDPNTDHEMSADVKVRISDHATMEEWELVAEGAKSAILSLASTMIKKP